MVDVKTVVVSIVAVLSAFLQPGIKAQPTIDSSSEDDSCPQLEERCESETLENMRLRSVLGSERQTMKTLENVSYSQAEEIQRLKLELEDKQQKIETLESERRRLRTLGIQSVTATFIGSLDHLQSHVGIAKVEDKIYALDDDPDKIKIYEDLIGFRFVTDILLTGTNIPYDIVYSNKSKCVYISDFTGKCIWVMTTTGEHRFTKWLTNTNEPHTLSLSNEGHLLVLRSSYSFSQLDIYSLNATLIRRLQLPTEVRHPLHVVQTSTGNFIICHRMNDVNFGPWVISQLTNDGQLIHRFIPRNQSEELKNPYHLSLDLDSNRLFVADSSNNRVILFDSNDLTWSQVLVSQDMNGIIYPCRLFYDASKTHLFVLRWRGNITVYELN